VFSAADKLRIVQEADRLSRATLYRATHPPAPPTARQRAPSPRRLGDDERQAILDVMHSAEFVDQPPMEVFAKLLSRGVYLASIRDDARRRDGDRLEPPARCSTIWQGWPYP
jgi:hypothetical protein